MPRRANEPGRNRVGDKFLARKVQLGDEVLRMSSVVALDTSHLERVLGLINYCAISQRFWLSRWHDLKHTRLSLEADCILAPTRHAPVIIFALRFELQSAFHIVTRMQLGEAAHRSIKLPPKIVCRWVGLNFASDVGDFTAIHTVSLR